MDWSNLLYSYRRLFVPNSDNIADQNEFYHDCNNRDMIVITAGDSWTWGDSLDKNKRLSQVYGRLVAEQFNADWINIGSRGRSNSWVLKLIEYLILDISAHYQNIKLIITLTENGRDIETPYTFPYDYRGEYNNINDDVYLDKVLEGAEKFWSNQLLNIRNACHSSTTITVGQNFVWNNINPISGIKMLNDNWIEKLADSQSISRPIRTNLVTGWIFPNIEYVLDRVPISKTNFNKWALPKIELATKVNEWLDQSKFNYKKQSKHPTAEGHQIWADYILEKE